MIETPAQPEWLFGDGHQDVSGKGDPHLRLHGVLGGALESPDPQVLFDPGEEQFHPPAPPIEMGDDQGKQGKIVAQEGQPGLFLGVEVHDAAQGVGVALGRAGAGEANGLGARCAGRTAGSFWRG